MAKTHDRTIHGWIAQDPEIREMAEQLANDPSFQAMAGQLQKQQQSGQEGAMPNIDPEAYTSAMQNLMNNPQFMQVAEKLGSEMMQDPAMAGLFQGMGDDTMKQQMEKQMEVLKSDPEIAPILREIEEGGMPAMMKYWNDPEMLQKLGKAMGGGFPQGFQGMAGAMGGGTRTENQETQEGQGEEEEEEEEEEEDNIISAASAGDLDAVQAFLEAGADKDMQDSEGRAPIHFASGYGEMDIVETLIKKGADLNILDKNKNTPLHYAAGYGQKECCELLVKNGASVVARNTDGKTPMEVAKLNDQNEVVEVFEQSSFI
mmetsp:Transcript_6242/g.38785  ORF Transcript_6242/g.38785 Transcript_6242/m.38785 type:complete len:316 (+) Transcript_6242:384-1331(+)